MSLGQHSLSPLDSPTPKGAANALAANVRAALQCVVRAEVFGSGSMPGIANTLTIVSPKSVSTGLLLLRKPDRTPYLQLEVSIEYTVAYLPEDSMRQPYRAVPTTYLYAISNLLGNELFAYHWHPEGVSQEKTPHLHVTGAIPLRLPVRPGSPEATELALSRAHFPTHRIELAELIRFLIRDPGSGIWELVRGDLIGELRSAGIDRTASCLTRGDFH